MLPLAKSSRPCKPGQSRRAGRIQWKKRNPTRPDKARPMQSKPQAWMRPLFAARVCNRALEQVRILKHFESLADVLDCTRPFPRPQTRLPLDNSFYCAPVFKKLGANGIERGVMQTESPEKPLPDARDPKRFIGYCVLRVDQAGRIEVVR